MFLPTALPLLSAWEAGHKVKCETRPLAKLKRILRSGRPLTTTFDRQSCQSVGRLTPFMLSSH